MVSVACKKSGDTYESISFTGHAGFDVKGKDIVCAAVSVLFINTVNSIERFTDDEAEIKKDEKSETISVSFKKDLSKESILLLDSMMLGMDEIKKAYGEKFISVIYE